MLFEWDLTMMKKLFAVLSVVFLASCSSQPKEKPRYIIQTPYGEENIYDETITPEVYAILATRVTNKMLDETFNIYEKSSAPTLYVMEVKKAHKDMPNGFYYSRKVSKDIIEGSRTFKVVNNMNDAEYYLEAVVIKIPLEDNITPAVQYKITMYDKNNKKINEWSEILQQVQNDDKSWW